MYAGMMREVKSHRSGTFWRLSMRQLQAPICRTPSGEQRGRAGQFEKMVAICSMEELLSRGAAIRSGKRDENKKQSHMRIKGSCVAKKNLQAT